jgi:hypothetical protein
VGRAARAAATDARGMKAMPKEPEQTSSGRGRVLPQREKRLELAAVLSMLIAGVNTVWSGYEAAR